LVLISLPFLVRQDQNRLEFRQLREKLGFPLRTPLVGILTGGAKYVMAADVPLTEENIFQFLCDFKQGKK